VLNDGAETGIERPGCTEHSSPRVEDQPTDDNRVAFATGHRADRRGPRRTPTRFRAVAEPQTRLFWD
jgi:hypothetical protein